MKVYRCWWCTGFLKGKGKDCGKKVCIENRRSGPWKKKAKK